MTVRVIRLRDRELADLLRVQGNFDYTIELGTERAYVRRGVDRIWVCLTQEQDTVLCIRSEKHRGNIDTPSFIKQIVKEYLTTSLEVITR